MIKLIAETAWHHEGDVNFLKQQVKNISHNPNVDIIKLHITLDLEEYMTKCHPVYKTLSNWMISEDHWEEVIQIIKKSGKKLLLLLNDTKAIAFAKKFNPEYIEVHSVAVNVPRFSREIANNFEISTGIFIGVGGCTLEEIDHAYETYKDYDPIMMFGFQNYPTQYKSINLSKVQKLQRLYKNARYGYADHCSWDEKHNELITLMVASNNMDFIEKHVTLFPGVERCDYSAAIAIEQLNELSAKLKILDELKSDGKMSLNVGEIAYSKYGPMKMAPLLMNDVQAGKSLKLNDIDFKRTSEASDISQLDIYNFIGKPLTESLYNGKVLMRTDFE